ncbi:MAG: RNA-binding protein [Methylococcaceae bacterium]|nr:MAG: RNA-binding protein [Methylococcaceae bacterium]
MAIRLFVGNLPFTATSNDVLNLFSQAGNVSACEVVVDKMTNRSRGFAFVEMPDRGEAERAIEMFHNKDFSGRSLTVNEARPREERPRREGGFRAGGGGRRDFGGGGGFGGGGDRDRRR